MSETWITNNIFTTVDAIRYSTTFEGGKAKADTPSQTKYSTGGFDSL